MTRRRSTEPLPAVVAREVTTELNPAGLLEVVVVCVFCGREHRHGWEPGATSAVRLAYCRGFQGQFRHYRIELP